MTSPVACTALWPLSPATTRANEASVRASISRGSASIRASFVT